MNIDGDDSYDEYMARIRPAEEPPPARPAGEVPDSGDPARNTPSGHHDTLTGPPEEEPMPETTGSRRRRRWPWSIVAGIALVATIMVAEPASASSGITWCDTHEASMAILGDSYSTGYGTTGYASPDGTYAPTTYGWWARMSADYASWLGTKSFNYAHNGAEAADYLPGGRWASTTGAVTQLAANQPALVLISLGINEAWNGVSPNTYFANLSTLVHNVQAADPAATILLVREPEADGCATGVTCQPWSAYALNSTATQLGVGLIDEGIEMPSTATAPAGVYGSDHVHPSDIGNLIEQAIIMGVLGPVCWR